LCGFFPTAASKDIIHFHGHIHSQLALNSSRDLVAIRSVASRIVDFLSQRTIHTTSHEVDITRALERLLKGRLGTIEPTPIPISKRREVGTPVIENLVFKTVQIARRLLDSVIWSESVKQPISAA